MADLAPDAAEALVDADAVSRYITISGAGDDEMSALLAVACSAAVEQYCGRRFRRSAYVEHRDGTGGPCLLVRAWPLVSVEAVHLDGRAVAPSGYAFGDRTIYLAGGAVFARGRANVRMEYTAGYEIVPADVRLAVLELVAYAAKRKDRVGLASEGQAGQQTNYITADMPAPVKAMLAPYRNVVPV